MDRPADDRDLAGSAPVETRRHFTRPGEQVFDSVRWEVRSPRIETESGEVVFEQEGVEVPEGWSTLAVNIVASKYFRGTRASRFTKAIAKLYSASTKARSSMAALALIC